jgi:histone H3/H4
MEVINKNKIAELIRKNGKKPSKEALSLIDKILSKNAQEIIERAKRKADFSGRKIILAEDLE